MIKSFQIYRLISFLKEFLYVHSVPNNFILPSYLKLLRLFWSFLAFSLAYIGCYALEFFLESKHHGRKKSQKYPKNMYVT